jgi:hypothetical protein
MEERESVVTAMATSDEVDVGTGATGAEVALAVVVGAGAPPSYQVVEGSPAEVAGAAIEAMVAVSQAEVGGETEQTAGVTWATGEAMVVAASVAVVKVQVAWERAKAMEGGKPGEVKVKVLVRAAARLVARAGSVSCLWSCSTECAKSPRRRKTGRSDPCLPHCTRDIPIDRSHSRDNAHLRRRAQQGCPCKYQVHKMLAAVGWVAVGWVAARVASEV